MLVRDETCGQALPALPDPVALRTVPRHRELMLSHAGHRICFGGVALIPNPTARGEVVTPTTGFFSVSLKTDVFGSVQTDSS